MAEATSYPERLQEIHSYMQKLMGGQGEVMQGFSTTHKATAKSSALDAKTKELIALAIAVAEKCDDCIAFHTHDALKAGASEAEIMDALGVAVLMGGGPAVMHSTHVLKAMEQFQQQS